MILGNESAGAVDIAADPPVTLRGDVTFASSAGRSLNLGDGLVTLEANATITVENAASTLDLDGGITESGGSFAITKEGMGILRLRNVSNYSGGTIINAGELQLGDETNLGSLGTGPVENNASLLLRGTNNILTKVIANDISGTGSLRKIDNIRVLLSGTNSYSGATSIEGGFFTLAGTHTGAGLYLVYAGATLIGDGGSTDGDLSAYPGATLDPTPNGLTLAGFYNDISGATLLIEVDGDAAGQFDTLSFTDALNIDQTVLDTTGSDITSGSTTPITIIDGATEPVYGTFAGLPDGATVVIGSQLYQIDYDGGADGFDVVLTPLGDPVVTIAAAATDVVEGAAAAFTVTANPPPSGGNITVTLGYSGTAADGSDFTGQASVNILAGTPSATVNLPTVDDGRLEGAESLTATITALGGATAAIGLQDSATTWLLDANSAPADGPALHQSVVYTGSPAALGDITVSDEAGGTSRVTGAGTPAAFVYNGLANQTVFGAGFTGDTATNVFVLSPNPSQAAGFSVDLVVTPTPADVAAGANYRWLWDVGGSANGCGVYLIDGVPHFVAKMNGADTDFPAALSDADWTGNAVCTPLTASALVPNQRHQIALAFDLDSVEFSVDGSAPVTVAFTNRGTRSNWHGTPSVAIGTADPDQGKRGGLSTSASSFLRTSYQSLQNAGAGGAVTSCRFWNTATGTIAAATAVPETITATLTIRGWTADATQGALTATSGNGESYAAGTWSITGGLAAVNTALAAVEFLPGTATLVVIDVSLDDQTSVGATTGAIILATTVPTLVYVDDSFTVPFGGPVADADLGTPGNQPATLGYDAFTTVAAAIPAVDPAGTILVNDGDYSAETVTLTGSVMLQLADTAGGVVIGSLDAPLTCAIDLASNGLTLGNDATDNTIDCSISGFGGLTKTGSDRLALRGTNTYQGGTTVSAGFLRVGSLASPLLIGSLASDVYVDTGATLEFNPALDLTITHSTQITGPGAVACIFDGTVVFDGPLANTFEGGFTLGDGAISDWDGQTGGKNGFVVVTRADHLGSGPVSSRGGQLQAGTPGLVIPNDITILTGGLRLGGPNDFELSGTLVPSGALRGIGNYGLEARTITLSGTLDMDGSGTPINCNLDGNEGADNGNFIITGNITGSATFGLNGNFDNAVAVLAGSNTYAGITPVNAGTLVLDGTHTGGGSYTVASGATLAGTGSTDSAVVVYAGATLAPGNGIGTLTVGELALYGTLAIEIDGTTTPGVDYDQLAVTGSAAIDGAALALDFGSAAVTGTATVLDLTDVGSILGEFAGLPDGPVDPLVTGWAGAVAYLGGDGNDFDLTVTGITPRGAWRLEHFASPANSGPGADAANTDGDPADNLLEFAFGTDPTAADGGSLAFDGATVTPGAPAVHVAAGPSFTARFLRRKDHGTPGSVSYSLEFSSDLTDWETSTATPAVVADAGAWQLVEVPFPATLGNGSTPRFFRLAIIPL